MLELNAVQSGYGETQVLHGLSLEARPGAYSPSSDGTGRASPRR